jgi:ribosomal protein S12 methylthiotransferase
MRRSPKKQTVHVVTLGCAKNVVDSESLLAQLKSSNLELSPTIEGADVAVINTCGFIEAAKRETLETIFSLVRHKQHGRLKRIYAMGCLTERYREELRKELPEVDMLFGTHELCEVVEQLGATYKYELLGERILTTPAHSAYLKISEGCDNPCSFCAIPMMRGRHISRSMESLLDEANRLAEKGVHEIVIIGQDTTYYGLDLYGKRRLAELLEKLAATPGVQWIRLMYAYPANFPLDLLPVIAENPKLCSYLDLPVQHVSESVLKSMQRGVSRRALQELLLTIRERVPGIALRTTLIVGYPGETEKEFQELLEFVQEVEFERLGVFTYSQEEGTTAFVLGDPVPADEKERRKAVVMQLQQEISERRNEKLIGSIQQVMIDRREGEIYVGRTQWDAPEVDNEVIVRTGRELNFGSLYDVEIVGSSEYDLEAIV